MARGVLWRPRPLFFWRDLSAVGVATPHVCITVGSRAFWARRLAPRRGVLLRADIARLRGRRRSARSAPPKRWTRTERPGGRGTADRPPGSRAGSRDGSRALLARRAGGRRRAVDRGDSILDQPDRQLGRLGLPALVGAIQIGRASCRE